MKPYYVSLYQIISHFRVIPTDTRAVLLEFIETIAAPFTTVQLPDPSAFRSDDNYQDGKLDVFPSLNQVCGLPKFKADSLFHRENGKDTENSSRKNTKVTLLYHLGSLQFIAHIKSVMVFL